MTEHTEKNVDTVSKPTDKTPETTKKKHPILWSLLFVSVAGIGIGTYLASPQIKTYLKNLKAPVPAPNVLPIPETVTVVTEPMVPKAELEEQRIILLEAQNEIKQACHTEKTELENKLLTLQKETHILQKELEISQKQLTTLQNAPQQDLSAQALRLTDLLARIQDGKPFVAFLSDLRKGMPTNSLLKQIEQDLGSAGATGIPTVADIQKTFMANASDYEEAVMTCAKMRSHWYGKIWFKLRTLVRIRPVVIPADATCPRWLFYKASDEISAGNLGQALITLRQLPTEKQNIFIPLMKQMELRLKLTHLLSETGENK